MIKRIVILIILFYEFGFVKTRLLLIRLKRNFKWVFEIYIFFILARVNLLFIFIIIKINKKNIYCNEIFKIFNIYRSLKSRLLCIISN